MEKVNKLLENNLRTMVNTGHLYVTSIPGDELWETYIKGFQNDPIFRCPDSSLHTCNYCMSFIRRYAGIVAVNPQDYSLITLFDNYESLKGTEYYESLKDLAAKVKAASIKDKFVETFNFLSNPRTPYELSCKNNQATYKLGVQRNIKRYTKEEAQLYPNSGIKPNQTVTFNHLFLDMPKSFIDFSGRSAEDVKASYRQVKDVFKRGLDEITPDTFQLVLDLEAQGSLLNGASYKSTVIKALSYAKEYEKLGASQKDNFAWLIAEKWGHGAAFRNTAIGTLLVDLSEGKEINEACKAFNYKVDPQNYMKASAPITKKQIEEAQKFVEENGYEESLNRRCATIDDIDVNEILHSNVSACEPKTKISVFDNLKPTTHSRHKKSEFDKVEEVTIDKFMKDILPGCTQVELFLDNKHKSNFVTLLTSCDKSSKSLFKWDNNFSWTYTGNLAGKSQIKQAVKSAGGFVDAPFRCSMMWNENGDAPYCDLDLHCVEGNRADEIFFGSHNICRRMADVNRYKSKLGGVIDIDITNPTSQGNNGVAVENIFYPEIKDGTYKFFIHNYNNGNNQGVKAEIFFNGETYKYEVNHRVTESNDINLATITIKNGEIAKIEHGKYFIGSDDTPETVYGLDTCKFHRVNLICLSPNFWNGAVGNKHYFFFLEGAMSPEKIRSIHNEFLNTETAKHRKVFEVLGSQLQVESVKGQLSGLGFNATIHDEIVLRLSGSFKRVIKVKF